MSSFTHCFFSLVDPHSEAELGQKLRIFLMRLETGTRLRINHVGRVAIETIVPDKRKL